MNKLNVASLFFILIFHKSGAQVLLKYQLERGVVVIPKSHNQENQAVNLDLFDFQLTAADVAKIEKL